jgi:DnaJ-class molecular chaperone
MDKYINYYAVLGLTRQATAKQIKMAYYKISMNAHPDKGGDEDIFKQITDAYKILSDNELKNEYDNKSKFGNSYDELSEIYDYEFKNDAKNYDKDKYEDFVKRDQLNILIYVDDAFDGVVEYERWVPCKDCHGSGMSKSAKMNMGSSISETYYFETEKEAEDFIQDETIVHSIVEIISSVSMILMLDKLLDSENIKEDEYIEQKKKYEKQKDFIKVSIRRKPKVNFFDLSDECEFCDGTGKWGELDCFYCSGAGKINGSKCKKCDGEKRILGKQKLSNITFPKDSKDFKIEHMGNYSRDIPGKSGHIWLIKKSE